jgi:hypothetical protein
MPEGVNARIGIKGGQGSDACPALVVARPLHASNASPADDDAVDRQRIYPGLALFY